MQLLKQLIDYGQSYWMDNLSRAMIKNGELEKRVSEQGLRGITSNPAIFNKAITQGNDYDEQIQQLAKQNKNETDVFETLAVKDVQDACDILMPVYNESKGGDGFVSLEVSPYLAHDTDGTIEEVRRLYKAVDRPNVLIKIPGTDAGIPAIEQMLYEGVNINITLLFSIESYEKVARAYIRALQYRDRENKSVDNISSVASFFLSRIDVMVDELLGQYINPYQKNEKAFTAKRLRGTIAVANAKLAYQKFKEIFSGDDWEKLKEKGARVQRPLWASTSTKNPNYRDVKYVEPLIGDHTVNTMPEETIAAFADHGVVIKNVVERSPEESREVISELEKLGIEMNHVTKQLVYEGVQKFIEPYDNLMKNIKEQIEKAK